MRERRLEEAMGRTWGETRITVMLSYPPAWRAAWMRALVFSGRGCEVWRIWAMVLSDT